MTMKPLIAISALTLLLAACGGKSERQAGNLPDDFAALSDGAKVEYMMQQVGADSVARFICNAALGKVDGVRIDTLAIAAAYAYEHYNDSALIVFSQEFDDFSANLPLNEKMKIYSMAGNVNPHGLGYELGLEYVTHIRENRMTVEDIRAELAAFKEACGADSTTYTRFIKGFQTVLKVDHGKDLPEEIYKAFTD